MPVDFPLTAACYYDSLPIADHRTGDIWRNLPVFGNLGCSVARGIVITPACDLVNRKCESITYLPIISAHDYLGSVSFRFECWNEILPLLSRLPGFDSVSQPSRYELIAESDLVELISPLCDIKGKVLLDAEVSRLQGYLRYVRAAAIGQANVKNLWEFVKPDRMKSYLERLVTNSLKPDVHFLPRDGKPDLYSAVPMHSVVLFRYPLSIPVDALLVAQVVTPEQWGEHVSMKKEDVRVLNHMAAWPVKLAALQGEFLGDMISRYVNMYIRLGSSDFSEQTVSDISSEIGGGQ